MKFSTLLPFVGLAAAQAQNAVPYTDPQSGISFNAYINPSTGYLFGLALPENSTGSTDFIATIGGKGTGWSGVSLGGGMLNKLLIVAWPNLNTVVSSFRKTGNYGSPPVVTGSFTQTPIANGTYVNGTHWTYTFLCSKCIQSDRTTFTLTDRAPSLGFALNTQGPQQRADRGASVTKHSNQGQMVIDLSKAKNSNFATWQSWAVPAVVKRKEVRFEA